MMLIGITRALDMAEQQKSLADILMHTNAAGFLLDLHGVEHTDEIGVHTVLSVLQRTSYRDACQAPPCPVVPHHVPQNVRAARASVDGGGACGGPIHYDPGGDPGRGNRLKRVPPPISDVGGRMRCLLLCKAHSHPLSVRRGDDGHHERRRGGYFERREVDFLL